MTRKRYTFDTSALEHLSTIVNKALKPEVMGAICWMSNNGKLDDLAYYFGVRVPKDSHHPHSSFDSRIAVYRKFRGFKIMNTWSRIIIVLDGTLHYTNTLDYTLPLHAGDAMVFGDEDDEYISGNGLFIEFAVNDK